MAEAEMYREEDRHECGLIETRVNALLYSQAFLAVLAGQAWGHAWAFLLIAIASFLLVVTMSLAILAGCRVLFEWHAHGTEMMGEDRQGRNYLDRYFLYGRLPMPDRIHKLSVNLFSFLIPFILGAAWLVAIGFFGVQHTCWGNALETGCVVAFVAWLALMNFAWRLGEGTHMRQTVSLRQGQAKADS